MTVYPDSLRLEMKLNGTWVNVIRDVVGRIQVNYGIMRNEPTARVAGIGFISFDLNNTDKNSAGISGYYTPGHPEARSGFDTGISVRILISFGGMTIKKFEGKIPPKGIKPETGRYGAPITKIIAYDWMEQAANYNMKNIGFETDLTMAEAVAMIIADMPEKPPGVVEYYDMESVFPTVFDTVKSQTTALSEMAKLVFSEIGYLYLTRHGLAVEGRFTRTNTSNYLTAIPVPIDYSSLLAEEGGAVLQTEDGRSIILNQQLEATFDNAQIDMEVAFGANLFNLTRFIAYPRRTDSDNTTVLFELQNPIRLVPDDPAVIQGRYRDPDGGTTTVSGRDLQPLVAGTHYLMNSAADGTGTNLTDDLLIEDIELGAGGFRAQITNTTGAEAWITKLDIIGRGVYLYDPLEYVKQNDESISTYGVYPLVLDMKYQNDPLVAQAYSVIMLSLYDKSKMVVSSVEYNANRSLKMMAAFLHIEPGDMVHLIEDTSGTDRTFFVQGVSFSITPGGLINYRWAVKEADQDLFAFWELGVAGKSEIGVTTRLNV